MDGRKISIDARKGFTKEFILKNEDGKEVSKILIGVTTDNYNNPILHITPFDEAEGTSMFENPNTLEYDLIRFCEDVAIGYLSESSESVFEICKSLRRTADILEYKYIK